MKTASRRARPRRIFQKKKKGELKKAPFPPELWRKLHTLYPHTGQKLPSSWRIFCPLCGLLSMLQQGPPTPSTCVVPSSSADKGGEIREARTSQPTPAPSVPAPAEAGPGEVVVEGGPRQRRSACDNCSVKKTKVGVGVYARDSNVGSKSNVLKTSSMHLCCGDGACGFFALQRDALCHIEGLALGPRPIIPQKAGTSK